MSAEFFKSHCICIIKFCCNWNSASFISTDASDYGGLCYEIFLSKALATRALVVVAAGGPSSLLLFETWSKSQILLIIFLYITGNIQTPGYPYLVLIYFFLSADFCVLVCSYSMRLWVIWSVFFGKNVNIEMSWSVIYFYLSGSINYVSSVLSLSICSS